MRQFPIALLALLVLACGPSEVAVEEAGRQTDARADASAAPQPVAPIDLGDGLMLAVEKRGNGDFVRSGGRLRVHYRARCEAAPVTSPPEPEEPKDLAEPGDESAEAGVSRAETQTVVEAVVPIDAPDDEPAPAVESPPVEVEAETPVDELALDAPQGEAPVALAATGPIEFDSSFARGVPDVWNLSNTARPRLIEGLRRGLVGLTVGSRLTLTIPAALAWGEDGLSSAGVPPNAEVVFEIEILEVLP